MITQNEHSAEEVERTLEDILAGPEFNKKPSLLDEFLRDLDFDPSGIATIGRPLALVFSAVAVGVVVFLLVRWMRRAQVEPSSHSGGGNDPHAAAARVRALLASAVAARAAGDLRGALRSYIAALILGLAEGDGLRYHHAWTNRELLRRGEPSARVRRALEPIVGEYEPKEFGRESIEEADISRLAALCDELLTPLLSGTVQHGAMAGAAGEAS